MPQPADAVSAADPAETESVRDRRHDAGGIERGGQRHPAHAKVTIGSQLPGDLHGEPRLAGTPDTADRDHTRRSEQVGELGAFPLASNEPSEIGRQRVPEELGIDRHNTPHRSLGSALAARTYSDDRTGVHSCALPDVRRQPARHGARFLRVVIPRTGRAREVTLADDYVVLDAVSQIGPSELWVTAQIVFELTPCSASGGIWSGSPAESLRNPARSSFPEKSETPGSTRESGGFGERQGSDVVVELELFGYFSDNRYLPAESHCD